MKLRWVLIVFILYLFVGTALSATKYQVSHFGGVADVGFPTHIELLNLTDTWNMTWSGNVSDAGPGSPVVTYTNSSGDRNTTMAILCIVNSTEAIKNISVYHDALENLGETQFIYADNITVWVSGDNSTWHIPDCDLGYGKGRFMPNGGYIEINSTSWDEPGDNPFNYHGNGTHITENCTIFIRLQLNITEGTPAITFYNNSNPPTGPTPHIFASNGTFGKYSEAVYFTTKAEVTRSVVTKWSVSHFGGNVTVDPPPSPSNIKFTVNRFGGKVQLVGYNWTAWSSWWNITQSPLAVNQSPSFELESPTNGTTGVAIDVWWEINISDFEGDTFNWTIECSNGQSSNANGASNGTKQLHLTSLSYSTLYTVWVNATDWSGSGNWTREWFVFTTRAANQTVTISSPNPNNNSVGVSQGLAQVSITIQDPEGDTFNWSIDTAPDVGNNSAFGQSNGSKTCNLAGLVYDTTYTWWVNATDLGNGTTIVRWYRFTVQSAPSGNPDPPYNSSATYYPGVGRVNVSWTRGNYSDQEVIVRKVGSYPTSETDGTIVYNNTNLWANITAVTGQFFTIWSYNATNNTFSLTGEDIAWGVIGMSCYNESKPSQNITFDILITNDDASSSYQALGLNNIAYVNTVDVPYGDNTIFYISADDYKSRVYYYDILPGTVYNLTFYLPPITTGPGAGGGGGGYENYSRLYRLRVIDDFAYPLANATVTIRRYINTTGEFETISILITNGYGESDVWLLPNALYKVFIDKSGYSQPSPIPEWIPDPIFYGADYPKIFQMNYEGVTVPEKTFWDICDFTGYRYSNGTIQVNFSCSEGDVTNAQFHTYEIYNLTEYLNATNTTTNNTFSFWVTGLNTSRVHRVVVHINHSQFGYDVVSILVFGWNTPKYNNSDIENKIVNAIGEFDLGWVMTFLVYIPMIGILVIFGKGHNGLGIIVCGAYGALASVFLVLQDQLIAVLPVIIFIGGLLLAVKGGLLKL